MEFGRFRYDSKEHVEGVLARNKDRFWSYWEKLSDDSGVEADGGAGDPEWVCCWSIATGECDWHWLLVALDARV